MIVGESLCVCSGTGDETQGLAVLTSKQCATALNPALVSAFLRRGCSSSVCRGPYLKEQQQHYPGGRLAGGNGKRQTLRSLPDVGLWASLDTVERCTFQL